MSQESIAEDVSQIGYGGSADFGAPFNFDLDFFSGPLDLLLHLVRTEEVSIEEVKMSVIADKYLAIINNSKIIDLEKAAEYLVIAATLMSIKSQSILSKNVAPEEEEDAYPGSDFYEQLRERLKQYELTKMRAEALRQLPQLNVNTFTRPDRVIPKSVSVCHADDAGDADSTDQTDIPHSIGDSGGDEIFFEKTNSSHLISAFAALLQRVGEAAKTILVKLEHISVVNYMMKIVDDVSAIKVSGMFALIKKYAQSVKHSKKDQADAKTHVRGVLVGSFIAVLELMKRGLISAEQAEDGNEIVLKQVSGGATVSEEQLSSEFDDGGSS